MDTPELWLVEILSLEPLGVDHVGLCESGYQSGIESDSWAYLNEQ